MTRTTTEAIMIRTKRALHTRTATLLAVISGTLASSAVLAVPLERHAERPAGQSGGTSYMERSVTLSAAGFLEFSYFVDSEQDHDFLRVYVDDALKFEQSGADRIGRVRKDLTAGTHTIRFAYEKNGSVSTGLDTAQVDDVTVKSTKGQEHFRFDAPALGSPSGWTTGGNSGGWVVAQPTRRGALQRPASAAFSGYTASGVVSSTKRSITWPSGSAKNVLKVGYLVDSEADKDFFRIYVDGVEKFAKSGAGQSGVASIDVGGSGAHEIRFAYEKDESVDEGMDDARVLRLEAIADGEAFHMLDLDDEPVGGAPAGWSAGEAGHTNWTVAPSLSPLVFVEPQGDSPTVDGVREGAYSKGSRIKLWDLGTVLVAPGKLNALLSGTSLFLHGRVAAETAAAGDESGTLTLYLDRKRLETLEGLGCSAASAAPGPEDRKIVVAYEIDSGGSTADVTTQQFIGTCSTSSPWVAASANQALDFEFAALEPGREEKLGFELSLDYVDEVDILGLALTLATEQGVIYEMPPLDAQPVADADVTSWATLGLSGLPEQKPPLGSVLIGTPRQPEPEPEE
jgi:hypothetical protein